MAVYNEGGCCGSPQLYVDTDKITEHAQTFDSARETFASLAGSVDFASGAGALAGSSLAGILASGTDVLGAAFKSHAERAGATGERFHDTAQEFSNQEEENANAITKTVA